MTSEQTYTLMEARRKLARLECAAHGHDWTVIEKMSGPTHIRCERCGESRKVEQP